MIGIDTILSIGEKIIDRVLPSPEAKAKAQLELVKLQQEGELAKMQADMSSDSWLSKNIRPMALIAIFGAYFLFAMMSAFGYDANQNYVQLLGQWGQIVFLAYFGGRTAEKIIEMKAKK